MAEIDIDKYTTDITLKNLVLIELHLAEFSNSPLFCRECLEKHALIISGAASECVGVCKIAPDIWPRLAVWGDKLREALPTLTEEEAEKFKAEAREFRKELQSSSVDFKNPIAGHLKE